MSGYSGHEEPEYTRQEANRFKESAKRIMAEPAHGLIPSQLERLALLAEECGEVVQIVNKILRHGYESTHPDGGPTNRELLEKELGHIAVARWLMVVSKDVSQDKIDQHTKRKEQTINKWLHHNLV